MAARGARPQQPDDAGDRLQLSGVSRRDRFRRNSKRSARHWLRLASSRAANIHIEYRWAEGQYDRLPAMAADLVGRRVALLVTTGGEPAAIAAKAATSAIPITAVVGGDPVKIGLVTSLNRPGGNVTAVNIFTNTMESKRLGGLLHEVTAAKTISGTGQSDLSGRRSAVERRAQRRGPRASASSSSY